jgi:hypothetical protein
MASTLPAAAFYLATALLLASACTEIRQTVKITPEPVPEEIEGALWPDQPVHYCVVRDDQGFADYEDFVRLTERAFRAWGIAVVNDGACSGPAQQGNRVNEIGWGIPPQRGDDLHEAGFTRLLYERCAANCLGQSGPEIVEADIEITPDPPRRLASLDCLYSTLLHETGHLLGVHHLDSPAVMAPVSFTCADELTAADRQALDQLYPQGGQ